MDKETEARIEQYSRDYRHQEYPKMLYHADGRRVTVQSEAEESKLGGEFTTMAKAVAEKDGRDKRDAERIAVAQGAAAVASRK